MLPAGPLLWCFWGGVTYIETMPPETPAKGAAMKVHIEMDMTPEEARETRRVVRHDCFALARVGGDRRIVHHARFTPWGGRIVAVVGRHGYALAQRRPNTASTAESPAISG